MKSAWNDDLTGIPYYRTIFFEAKNDGGYMAYALGYVDKYGVAWLKFEVPDDDPEHWHVVRWLDPTRV